MTYKTTYGNLHPHPYAVMYPVVQASKMTETEKQLFHEYGRLFSTMSHLDAAVISLKEDVLRLTHENQFMLKLIEKHFPEE